MRVVVRTLGDRREVFEGVPATATVGQLRNEIWKRFGVPPANQKLFGVGADDAACPSGEVYLLPLRDVTSLRTHRATIWGEWSTGRRRPNTGRRPPAAPEPHPRSPAAPSAPGRRAPG